METGFRRLWPRKKSASRLRQPAKNLTEGERPPLPPQNASYLSNASYVSRSNGPTTPSAMRTRTVVPAKTLNDNGGHDFSPNLVPNDESTSRSGSRIQPVLLGISRPSTSKSRPERGSLEQAVSQAADAVTDERPSMSQAEDSYVKGHSRTRSPKYIDIFAVSTAYHSLRPRFNEDVAARNLDLKRVAKSRSSLDEDIAQHYANLGEIGSPATQNQYVPSSRYQEEVAQRNAHPFGLRDNSFDRPSFDLPARDPHTYSRNEATAASTTYNTARERYATEDLDQPEASGHSIADQSVRQHEIRRQDSEQQELFSTQESTRPMDFTYSNIVGRHQQKVASRKTVDVEAAIPQAIYPTIHTSDDARNNPSVQPRPQSVQPVPPALPQARVQVARPSLGTPQGSFQYTVSRNELVNARPHAAETTTQRALSPPARRPLAPRMISNDGSIRSSIRPGSALSNMSAVKRTLHLNTRTIMDLTGNDSDIFSDTYPESEYSASPVVATAVWDPVQKGHASLVEALGRNDRPAPLASIASSDEGAVAAPSRIHKDLSTEIQSAAEPPRTPAQRPVMPPKLDSASSFSRITTVASVPPSTQAISMPEGTSWSSGPAYPAGSKQAMAADPRQLIATAPNGREGLVRAENYMNKASGTSLPAKHNTDYTRVSTESSFGTSAPTPGAAVLHTTRQHIGDLQSHQPENSARNSNSTTPKSNIYNSPESLKSTDFVNPSLSFGVLTRDFALSTKPPPTLKQHPVRNISSDAIPQRYANGSPLAPTSRRRRAASNIRNEYVYKSSFNEEEFARKQADARAALTRLQESLAQNFDPPSVATPKSRDRGNGSDATPVKGNQPPPPTSKFAQSQPPSSTIEQEDTAPVGTANSGTRLAFYQMATQPITSNTSKPMSGGKVGQRPGSTTKMNDVETMLYNMHKSSTPSAVPRHSVDHYRPSIDSIDEGSGMLHAPARNTRNTSVPPKTTDLRTKMHTVPPSPGEVSLSSFPLPIPAPNKGKEVAHESPPSRTLLPRRESTRSNNSFRSQTSNRSAFSIPMHIVPGRTSSMRDRLALEEEDEEEAISFDL